MKPNVRAYIAYTAGRIVLEKELADIYDCTEQKSIALEGIVDTHKVEIEDKQNCCKLLGKGYNNSYELYNVSGQHFVELSIIGHTFKGYDYGKFFHFQGEVKGEKVSIYDYEFSQEFDYQLENNHLNSLRQAI